MIQNHHSRSRARSTMAAAGFQLGFSCCAIKAGGLRRQAVRRPLAPEGQTLQYLAAICTPAGARARRAPARQRGPAVLVAIRRRATLQAKRVLITLRAGQRW